MITVRDDGQALEVTLRHEVIRIEPWGTDSLRVRVGQHRITDDIPGALVAPKPAQAQASAGERTGEISNGALTAIVTIAGTDTGPDPQLKFVRTDTGEELLAEQRAHFWWPGARVYAATGNGYGKLEQRFR